MSKETRGSRGLGHSPVGKAPRRWQAWAGWHHGRAVSPQIYLDDAEERINNVEKQRQKQSKCDHHSGSGVSSHASALQSCICTTVLSSHPCMCRGDLILPILILESTLTIISCIVLMNTIHTAMKHLQNNKSKVAPPTAVWFCPFVIKYGHQVAM